MEMAIDFKSLHHFVWSLCVCCWNSVEYIQYRQLYSWRSWMWWLIYADNQRRMRWTNQSLSKNSFYIRFYRLETFFFVDSIDSNSLIVIFSYSCRYVRLVIHGSSKCSRKSRRRKTKAKRFVEVFFSRSTLWISLKEI